MGTEKAESNWFTERHAASGSAIGFRIEQQLHAEKTPYQAIEIYQTSDWGRLMVIDGCVMLTSRDNFLYHEMMTHPALFTHSLAKRVVIIGGGDCGTLREVLRHEQVEGVVQVDIDERVTRLAEEYFPELCDSNADPRAELRFADGVRYMAELEPDSLDLVIIDSTDPVGPAEGLFNADFHASCMRALRYGGILVQQSESPLLHLDLIRRLRGSMLDTGFKSVRTLTFPQPCYPSGWWSCTMARKGGELDSFRERAAAIKTFPTRYYSAAVHRAALATPPFMDAVLAP